MAHRKSISLNLAHFLIGVKKKKKKEQIELSQSKVPVKDAQLTSYIIMKNWKLSKIGKNARMSILHFGSILYWQFYNQGNQVRKMSCCYCCLKKKTAFIMERKKSKYIGDNILLYIENPEKKKNNNKKKTQSITSNKKLAEYKINT